MKLSLPGQMTITGNSQHFDPDKGYCHVGRGGRRTRQGQGPDRPRGPGSVMGHAGSNYCLGVGVDKYL